jgi:hypothetical protein
MRVARQLSVLLSSTCVILSIAAQTLSLPLQTDLSDRDLQTLEKLVETAQQNSGAVKEAKAELGISSWSDSVVFEISPSYSTGNFVEDREQFTGNERSISASLTLNPLEMLRAIQQRPTLSAKLKEARRLKRAEVVQAYITYLQAKQAKAIAQYRMQAHQKKTVADDESMTAIHDLFTANTNERVALENLAAVVGRSPAEILKVLR